MLYVHCILYFILCMIQYRPTGNASWMKGGRRCVPRAVQDKATGGNEKRINPSHPLLSPYFDVSLSYSSSFSLRKSIKQQQHQRKRILLSLSPVSSNPRPTDRPNGGTRTNELISLGELNERGEEECGTAEPSTPTLAAFFIYFLLCGCVCRRLSYLRGLEKIYAAVCCC